MLFDLFNFSSARLRNHQEKQFARKSTSIEEQAKAVSDYQELVLVFLEGFKESLHIETEPFILSGALWEDVVHLRDTKYATKTWNKKQKRKQGVHIK